MAARILLSVLAFGGAGLALRVGRAWIVLSVAVAAFGTLWDVAAATRELGCEANLIASTCSISSDLAIPNSQLEC